jgi:hypothetical protein
MTTPRGAESSGTTGSGGVVLCQACGAANSAERELCVRCQQKLLILSGPPTEESQELVGEREADFSLDEHLLGRVSSSKKPSAHRRTHSGWSAQSEAGEEPAGRPDRLRRCASCSSAAPGRARWSDSGSRRWSSAARSAQALQRGQDRIVALYAGDRRKAFVRLPTKPIRPHAFDPDRASCSSRLPARPPELRADPAAGRAAPTGADRGGAGLFVRVLEARPIVRALVFSGVIRERGGGAPSSSSARWRCSDAFLPHFCLGRSALQASSAAP